MKEGREYNVEMFKERRRILLESLDKPTQLSDFLKRNGETGAKIDSQLREFIDEIYGDDSIVLRLSNEGLRVDHSQHIKIYSYVVGLYETLCTFYRTFIRFFLFCHRWFPLQYNVVCVCSPGKYVQRTVP